MPPARKRTFSLPAKHADYIDSLVESGAYASDSDVVRAGIEALQDRDISIERWLREEVVPVYDAMKADPSRGIPIEDVEALLEAHHAERLKSVSCVMAAAPEPA
jgi:antitoxin ParD1/3/4